MDRKTLLGLGLIMVIVFLWPFYVRWVSPEQPIIETEKRRESAPSSALLDTVKTQTTIASKKATPDSMQAFSETAVTVRTGLFSAVISSRAGGTVKTWALNKYRDGNGQPVDFVHSPANFDRQFFHNGKSISFSSLAFSLSSADTLVELEDSAVKKIVFTAHLDLQSTIIVEHEFRGGSYGFKTRIDWRGAKGELGDEYRVSWISGLRPTEKDLAGDFSYFRAYAMLGEDKEEFDNTDEKSEVSFTGVTRWIATRTKYFVVYVIPTSKPGTGCRFEGSQVMVDGKVVSKSNQIHLTTKLENSAVDEFTTYIGPMDYSILGTYDNNLPIIMEWGWAIFRPLTKAILYTFNFLFGLIPNYGWVIIVFALIVKIILYPLTHKSYVGMQKMREVMPKQKELQKKFKDNPAKMQQELMKLYKEVGYNPLSGCLPLLIQMPILFPIYQVFSEAIDLRQAYFFGWISDLSVPDTVAVLRTGLPLIGDFNVNPLPIIMTILTFVQQKFTPMTPVDDSDPAQRFNQKFLLYGMPIMFFFIFNNFSSGLVLYWTVFNVLTMLQQLLMSKHLIK